MKQSFSSFCKENRQETLRKTTKENESQEEKMRRAYDELKDLNSDELSMRLFEEVKKQKENGTFDYISLSNSVERMRMFLPKQTYENMKMMLEKLK